MTPRISTRRARRLVLLLPLMLVTTLAACGQTPSATSQPPTTQQTAWHTVFYDNFDGAAGTELSSADWRYSRGLSSGMAVYRPTPTFASLDGNGDLVVQAIDTTDGWVSGQVSTTQTFAPKLGQSLKVEARIRFPEAGKGYWPAFWGLGAPALNNPKVEPAAGEVDIAETLGDDNWVAQLLHCGPAKFSGPCREPSPTISDHYHFATPKAKASWNVYSFVWNNEPNDQSSVQFYVDNKLQLVVTEKQIGAHYWNEAFDHPYFFLFNVEVGGWAGKPNQSTARTAAMTVSYFKVSRR